MAEFIEEILARIPLFITEKNREKIIHEVISPE